MFEKYYRNNDKGVREVYKVLWNNLDVTLIYNIAPRRFENLLVRGMRLGLKPSQVYNLVKKELGISKDKEDGFRVAAKPIKKKLKDNVDAKRRMMKS